MMTITPAFIVCIVVIIAAGDTDMGWFVDNVEGTFLESVKLQTGLNVTLLILGVLSWVLCLVHWKFSVVPLYKKPQEIVSNGGIEAEYDGDDEE